MPLHMQPKPPGPGLLFYQAGHSNKLELLLSLSEKYGDIAKVPGPVRTYLVNHPDHVQYILQNNFRKYPKGGMAMRPLLKVFDKSILVLQGEEWHHRRHLTQSFFHSKSIGQFWQLITETTLARFASWDQHAVSAQSFDIAHEMMFIVLTIATQALFSNKLSSEQIVSLIKTIATANKYSCSALLHLLPWLPTPGNLKYHAAQHNLTTIINGFIQERLQNPHASTDILSILLQDMHEQSAAALTRQEVINEAKTFLLTGHETTGTSLGWTWYLLAQHPEIMSKLQFELDQVLAGRIPSYADLENLTYTRMVFEEALRLYPPIWITGRKSAEDDQLGNYFIPAHSDILICPYTLHRHPHFWEDPEAFMPERFGVDQKNPRHRFAYIPFGGGQRVCIAGNFAMMQGLLILALIAQRYEVELVSAQPVEIDHFISLKPRDGIQVRVKRRS